MTMLTPDQRSVLMREGTFRGLKSLLQDRKITESEASSILSRSYVSLLEQVEEAKKEMQHIQTALTRLESICRTAKNSKNLRLGDPQHNQFGDTLVNFDNWVVSLMETNMTITGMLNPALTRNKITQFAAAMNALMDKRAAEQHPVLDDPKLFSGYVNW